MEICINDSFQELRFDELEHVDGGGLAGAIFTAIGAICVVVAVAVTTRNPQVTKAVAVTGIVAIGNAYFD